MRKIVVFTVIAMLILLAACSKTQTARPLNREATIEQPAEQEVAQVIEEGSGQTAAEALKELQTQMATEGTTTGLKTGSTGMPPAPAGVTGEDALKARTRALYSTGSPVTGNVVADRDFGERTDELPSEYNNDDSAGE